MKAILTFVLCSFIMFQETKDKFFNFVLSDFRTSSSFIVVDIKKQSYIEKAVIENMFLYCYFYLTERLDKISYKDMMKEKLTHHIPIELNDSILKSEPRIQFMIIPQVKRVDSVAQKGIEQFIDFYFARGKVQKIGLTDEERNAIIQKLFEWEIVSYIDDETGAFAISRRKK